MNRQRPSKQFSAKFYPGPPHYISKLWPGSPTQFFQRKSSNPAYHCSDSAQNSSTAAFHSAATDPELRIDFQFFMQLQGSTGSRHQILLRTCGSERSDTQSPTRIDR